MTEFDGNDDVVTPWSVTSCSLRGVDYDKLILRFGCCRLDNDLLARLEKLSSLPLHHLLRRKIFFSHR